MIAAPAAALLLAGAGPAAAGPATALPLLRSAPAPGMLSPGSSRPPGGGLAINRALSGAAAADSEQPGSPAANATDGDAGTDWCPTGWEGTLTVDLARRHNVDMPIADQMHAMLYEARPPKEAIRRLMERSLKGE